MRDEDDLEHCCDYIHYNPVKHGHAISPGAWPWSTFGRFVDAGDNPTDWGATLPATLKKNVDMGE